MDAQKLINMLVADKTGITTYDIRKHAEKEFVDLFGYQSLLSRVFLRRKQPVFTKSEIADTLLKRNLVESSTEAESYVKELIDEGTGKIFYGDGAIFGSYYIFEEAGMNPRGDMTYRVSPIHYVGLAEL
jgi:hypothetical protein